MPSHTKQPHSHRRLWIEVAGALVLLLAIAAAWKWTPLHQWIEPHRISDFLEDSRSRWFGLPLVIGVFVGAELLMFPLLVLVFACGVAFGPWLGLLYALIGAVFSAILPFLAGRWLGRQRLERWGGARAHKLMTRLKKGGIMAVFLVRKIPAPFTAVNVICGACGVRLVDFLVGTTLGMLTGILLITVIGSQLRQIIADPEPGQIALALGTLLGAVGLALLLQRILNRRLPGRT